MRKTKRDENLLKKRQTFAAPQYALEDSNKPGGAQRVGVGLLAGSTRGYRPLSGFCAALHARMHAQGPWALQAARARALAWRPCAPPAP